MHIEVSVRTGCSPNPCTFPVGKPLLTLLDVNPNSPAVDYSIATVPSPWAIIASAKASA